MANSWVFVDKQTGKAVYETWQERVARKANTDKYVVMTAKEYLATYNAALAFVRGIKGHI